MKTKIHNGFIINGAKSLDEVKTFIESIYSDINSVADDIWTTNVVNDAVLSFDYNNFYNKTFDGNYMADANELLEKDLLIACQKQIQTELDLEVRLYFQSIKDKEKQTKIIGLHFIPNFEIRKMFLDMVKVKDYSFVESDDQSNNQKNINRGVDWKNVFKYSSNPDISMFCINVTKTGPRKIEISKIIKFIPSKELRSQNLAHKLAIEKMMADDSSIEKFKNSNDVSNYLNSDEHISNVNRESLKIINSLHEITTEDLL